MNFPKLKKLFDIEDALQSGKEIDEIFFEAVKEVFIHHYENCNIYRNVCEQVSFTPESLKNYENISDVPWIMVNVFKKYHLTSIPEEQIVKTFTSSGTTGQRSHISWDEDSFKRQSLMRERIIESYGLKTSSKVNYLCFTFSPEIAGQKGAAFAHSMYTTFAPTAEKFFAIHPDSSGNEFFDPAECVEYLKKFEASGLALRIVGFPAFAWRTLQYLAKRDIKFDFSQKESLIIFGGGWKAMADEEIPKEVFNNYVEKYLGIPKTQIRDIYGFVEHGVPYVSCEHGSFHVPVFSRVFVRKPGTLKLLPKGEKGLLQMVTPYNTAQPNISVLSTDYGILRDNCPCGRKVPYIELAGRAGISKHQGCAITAAELLKK